MKELHVPSLGLDALAVPTAAKAEMTARPAIDLTVSRLTEFEAFVKLEELQRRAFGFPDIEIAPAALYYTAHKCGGHFLGAYLRGSDQMIGFIAALSAHDPVTKERYLHSDLEGVLPEYQSAGVGEQMKHAQRALALQDGISRICWTYDPMETKNANLNIRKLGATISRFIPNLYGDIQGDLQKGLPSHRFLAEWSLASHHRNEVFPDAPRFIVSQSGMPIMGGDHLIGAPALICELPLHFQTLKQGNLTIARQWQDAVCGGARTLLQAGYCVVGFSVNTARDHGEYHFKKLR